ncbi:MAG TPA: efflux RND transporter periplasmic adaptor subunit [Hyphomicrobiaceae bacterium]|nr:efflux RND transporter periplasmic adaptor subunit [Hyphomicrobiaceae bacterium]
MKRYLFTLALPVALAAAGALWLLGLPGSGRPETAYETVPVSRGPIARIVSTSGPVRALVTVSVGSQLSGQIRELKADFNSEVKKGDELAVIDDKSFAAKVSQARADLAAATAQLANQEAQLVKSEAALRLAERAMERTEALAGKGISSPAALDSATRDLDMARADVTVAKAQIESSKATILQRRAMLEQAEIDLDRTRIRSPIDGTVIARTVDVGQTVAASLQAPELFKIAQDLRRIRIEAQVNEADVGAVAEGNPVTFTVDAYPERRFTGRLTQVRLAATELNSIVTYTVIIEAANEDRQLFPGMTATVQIETDKRDGALRVPNEALRFRPRERSGPPALASGQSRESGERPRGGRSLEQLKHELQLSDEQLEAVRAALRKERAERGERTADRSASPPWAAANAADGGQRQRAAARIEEILRPLLTEAQRPLFDRWKRGRENSRPATVWVLAASGDIEPRPVRVGIADDRFAEIVGGDLKEGEAVVVRAREVKR